MANNSKLPDIRGDVIKKAREAKGRSLSEMSKDLCFSVKQIEQIESGDRSHFYSLAIKVAAAKRVADYLGLSNEEVFDFGPDLIQEIQNLDDAPNANPAKPIEQKLKPVSPTPPIPERMPERLERFQPPSEDLEPKKSKTKYVFFVFAAALAAVLLNIDFSVKDKSVEPLVAKLPTESIDTAAKAAEKKEDAPIVTLPALVATPVPAVVAQPSMSSENCPSPDANQATYRSPNPSKSGNMIYVSSRIKQVICIKDATGKLEKRSLEIGGSHSFYGKAPFVLMSSSLAQTDIFFQGYKVRSEDPNANSIILEEVPF